MFDPQNQSASTRSTGRSTNLRLRVGLAIGALLLLFVGATGSSLFVQQRTASAQTDGVLQLASLFQDQDTLADLYDQVAPSVVNIRVVTNGGSEGTMPFGLPGGDTPQQGQGSGFIYDAEGHIITNNHVVEDAEEITVIFNNGFWADAELVAADPQADLAVIKVTPPADFVWQPLPLAEPDALRVGYSVIAIGNPFGLDGTMTTGVISALGRSFPVGGFGSARYTLPEVIQTDAAINPGNSGGPLLDLDGRVVGVNFAIESPVRSNSGVGFAIPVSIVQRVVPALIESGRYDYAYLGLSGQSITPELADALDLDDNRLGIYVSEAVAGGPSATAGIQGATGTIESENGLEIPVGGDIVIAIDGESVRQFEDLVGYLVTEVAPSETVTLSVIRDGEVMDIDVTLGSRPSSGATARMPDSDAGEEVNAREAIQIAIDEVQGSDFLPGEIIEKVATPDVLDGADVWRVELSTATQTATVVVNKTDGEVIEMSVR